MWMPGAGVDPDTFKRRGTSLGSLEKRGYWDVIRYFFLSILHTNMTNIPINSGVPTPTPHLDPPLGWEIRLHKWKYKGLHLLKFTRDKKIHNTLWKGYFIDKLYQTYDKCLNIIELSRRTPRLCFMKEVCKVGSWSFILLTIFALRIIYITKTNNCKFYQA